MRINRSKKKPMPEERDGPDFFATISKLTGQSGACA